MEWMEFLGQAIDRLILESKLSAEEERRFWYKLRGSVAALVAAVITAIIVAVDPSVLGIATVLSNYVSQGEHPGEATLYRDAVRVLILVVVLLGIIAFLSLALVALVAGSVTLVRRRRAKQGRRGDRHKRGA